jgi:3-hydroxy acid dehydrogenase/malonic semialdehyde reductase
MFQTNVIGLIHLTQIIVRGMKKRQSGHVINLGSVAGREAYAGGAIYCATKRPSPFDAHGLSFDASG